VLPAFETTRWGDSGVPGAGCASGGKVGAGAASDRPRRRSRSAASRSSARAAKGAATMSLDSAIACNT
jgi:hypothetical protein